MIPLLPNQNKREVDLEMMSHISRVAEESFQFQIE